MQIKSLRIVINRRINRCFLITKTGIGVFTIYFNVVSYLRITDSKVFLDDGEMISYIQAKP